MARTYKVTKVNPVAKQKATKRKPAAKKKAAKRKPAAKKKAATKTNPKRKTAVAKRKTKTTTRRRRRRPATTTRKRSSAKRRTRSNPATRIDLKRPFGNFIPRTIGQMVTAAVVYKWGDAATGKFSPTAGYQWSMKNYFIGYITSLVGGEAIARFGGRKGWGQAFYDGGVQLMETKAVWTEIFARVPMLQAYLGQGDGGGEFQQLAAQAQDGDIIDDGNGTTWLLQNGQWVSMQGADPYRPNALAGDPYAPKELNGVLTDEDYLGGVLTDEDYLGGIRRVSPMGHAMPSSTSRAAATKAQYLDTGSPDPYHSAYQQ